jgi:adenosine deaminase
MSKCDFIALPKVALHDHLDGGVRATTLLELAQDARIHLPADTPSSLAKAISDQADSGSLSEYLRVFGWTVAVMQSYASLKRIAYEAVLDLSADGVVLGEIRFAPHLHTSKELTLQQAIDAVTDGLSTGTRDTGIPVGLILCALRHQSNAESVVDLFERNWAKDGLVVGVDLAGPEAGFPVTEHPAFKRLADRRHGAPITIHAGEAAGVKSIWEALEAGARRIGHGTRLIDDIVSDRRLVNVIRERDVLLEVCLSSNCQTGAAASILKHPLGAFLDEGLKVSIDADNRLVSATKHSDEIALACETFALSIDTLRKIGADSIDASFMPESVKKAVKEQHFASNALFCLKTREKASRRRPSNT